MWATKSEVRPVGVRRPEAGGRAGGVCVLAAALALGLLFPAGAWALPAGEPAGLVGPGSYCVGVESARLAHRLGGDAYETRGYFVKAQGGLSHGLDLYLRLGRESVYVPGGATSSGLDGDERLSLGGGVKIGLPPVSRLRLTSFLDLSAQAFRSGGALRVLQDAEPAPIELELDNEYKWQEYQAAWGLRYGGSLISPYGGVSMSWLQVDVTRHQSGVGGDVVSEGSMRDSALYRGFLGVEVRVTPAIGLALEAATDGSADPSFTVAVFEKTGVRATE